MKLVKINENIWHAFEGNADDSLLCRYNVLDFGAESGKDSAVEDVSEVSLNAKREVTFLTSKRDDGGFRVKIPLDKKERIFGLGDATRERIMIRGFRADMHVENVVSYGPMAVILSDNGWAFMLDSTYRSFIDCAKTDPNSIVIDVAGGKISFFIFRADTLKGLVGLVTKVSGRPALLPEFAYGLTLVHNEDTNARSLLEDICRMRDLDIPCDTMGLEPSWMETHYDFTVNKRWNPKLFKLPSWYPENSADNYTFFYPMREMGMKLSLWLCNDYDLFWEEERRKAAENKDKASDSDRLPTGAVIDDKHFTSAIRLDKLTKKDEPWFEHLKKFVDNGASAFKLDGAYQIIYHPDRLWGGKYTDDEIHNLYPVILAKQIYNGFAEYTGRRLLLYTSGAYLGTQQFAATWSGDTGGGPGTLVSMMNYAMCGHSNTACDIDPTDPTSIHYGFLTPWSQYFCWSNWMYPWFLGEEKENMIRFYSKLRSSLVPYLYTLAHEAYETGIAMLRPLPLAFEDTDRFDDVTNAYMLGDKLYVGAFDMNLRLPDGNWIDYFTEEKYEGGRDIEYAIPEGKGGALFVREGSVFVTMKPQKYVLEKRHDYVVKVYPGADDTFTLYEDDGMTFDYQNGGFAKTEVRMENTSEEGFDLVIRKREGRFEGRPDNGHDLVHNSIPKINGIEPSNDITIELHAVPASVTADGEPVDFELDGKLCVFRLPGGRHDAGDVRFEVRFGASR